MKLADIQYEEILNMLPVSNLDILIFSPCYWSKKQVIIVHMLVIN